MSITSRLLVQYVKDVTVVTFTDSTVIDTSQIDCIRRDLYDMVDNQFKRRMILDMTKVHHLSSSALGFLIPLREKVQKAKGELILCGVRPEIRKIFKITKLEKHFRFCDNESESLTALNVFVG